MTDRQTAAVVVQRLHGIVAEQAADVGVREAVVLVRDILRPAARQHRVALVAAAHRLCRQRRARGVVDVAAGILHRERLLHRPTAVRARRLQRAVHRDDSRTVAEQGFHLRVRVKFVLQRVGDAAVHTRDVVRPLGVGQHRRGRPVAAAQRNIHYSIITASVRYRVRVFHTPAAVRTVDHLLVTAGNRHRATVVFIQGRDDIIRRKDPQVATSEAGVLRGQCRKALAVNQRRSGVVLHRLYNRHRHTIATRVIHHVGLRQREVAVVSDLRP